MEKHLVFADNLNCKDASLCPRLHVVINEIIDADYGLYVWPCSVVLSKYLYHHRSHLLKGKSILEIGAGTGLPSILAVKCCNPSRVVITDKESSIR